MKRILLFFVMLFSSIALHAQIATPVTWSYSSKALSGNEAVLVITAKIDGGWHMYSQFIEDGGPVPTSFKFTPSSEYELVGKVVEKSSVVKGFDKTFNMNIAFFENKAVFEQKIKLKSPKAKVAGSLEFMVCDEHQCLPPEELQFSIPVAVDPAKFKETSSATVATAENSSASQQKPVEKPVEKAVDTATTSTNVVAAVPHKDETVKIDSTANKIDATAAPIVEDEKKEKSGIWGIFLQGFLFGFVALLMPCIFPMIPLTVSFFTKKSVSRAEGIKKAIIYGLSIIVIYLLLGLGVTFFFGSSKLNELASDATFNLIFFAILVVFAASFFGAFELTLPSSWATKADEKADKGGLIGIFFMALALAIASFSCTGPLIGTLLVSAASKGEWMGPFMGMLGFSSSLAIPFTLFAIFPNWLGNLPKSGGWLNAVKVVLGFIELAFALKFLSNVDLAYHWGILDREVFLGLWIVIFAMLGFYLLGKLKFSHDSDLQYISVPRLFLALLSFAFAIYMLPGLNGAPLKAISAFAPPMGTQDFVLGTNQGSSSGDQIAHSQKKYGGIFHAPHGIDAFFDYEEGLAYAQKVGKPVLVDFTGHSCVNCRKMEANVWSNPDVLKRIKGDYVLISLYVDDRTALPADEQYTSKFSGKQITTVGKKWSDIQASKYNTNSQPYYVLIDHTGKELVAPQGYNPDIANYVSFLDSGKSAFDNQKLTMN